MSHEKEPRKLKKLSFYKVIEENEVKIRKKVKFAEFKNE